MRFAPRGRRIAGKQPGLFRMNGFFLGKRHMSVGEKMSRREAMQRVVNAGGSFEYCSLIKNGEAEAGRRP